MNTESINTLKLIREAIGEVEQELGNPDLDKTDKKLLTKVFFELSKAESIIINETLMQMVKELNANNKKLEKMITDMEASSAKIAKLSRTIKKVSKVIGVLADITGKAITAGIL